MKIKSIYAQDVEPTVRKALIAANPDYFSWSKERQEKFRATKEWENSEKVNDVIWQSLFGKEYSESDDDELLPYQGALVNCTKLLMSGIGHDFLFLNEYLPDSVSLLDFSTLYDYDHNDYLFQESERKKSDKSYSGIPYYPFKFPPWIRLIVKDQFYYGSCLSCAGHIVDRIDAVSDDIIQELIPHQLINGKKHGQVVKEGLIWDMQLDANGQERQLQELQHRWQTYLHQRWLELSKGYSSAEPVVYVHYVEDDEDPYMLFIFNNQQALEQTRWKYFLADIAVLKQDYLSLEGMVSKDIARAESFLHEQHADIINNFDPTVVKLKKKRQIIMPPDLFDNL